MYMFSTSPGHSNFGRKTRPTWRFWVPFRGLGITSAFTLPFKTWNLCCRKLSGNGMPRIKAFWRYEMKCNHKHVNNLETLKIRFVNKKEATVQLSTTNACPSLPLSLGCHWSMDSSTTISFSRSIMQIMFTNFVVCCSHKMFIIATSVSKHYCKLEMRSVERGICPIATSIMNELFQ